MNPECVYSTDDAGIYFYLLRLLAVGYPEEPFVTIGKYQLWICSDSIQRENIIRLVHGGDRMLRMKKK